MTNRFNFRYWDKIENIMRTYDIGLAADGTPFVVNDDINNPITCLDNIVIMQCVDKKDCNNNLIYENDIIKCSYGSEYSIGVVKWDSEYNQFAMEVNNELFTFHQTSKYHKIEILGNIYENSKLLESEAK